MKTDNITLLCKVVDNYGDIGVVWRLARALSEYDAAHGAAPSACTAGDGAAPAACTAGDGACETAAVKSGGRRIIVDDLSAFRSVAPAIDPDAPVQQLGGWTILRWDAAEPCTRSFTENPPSVIVECFACGRPDWLEDLLFVKGVPETVQIINLEYLTAEPYAEEFHKLLSLTRSARVRKVNFLPGFTPLTGGLILDAGFVAARAAGSSAADGLPYLEQALPQRAEAAGALQDLPFTVTVFSYERNFSAVAGALARFAAERTGGVRVLSAAGKSASPFREAVDGLPDGLSGALTVIQLPFVPQQEWDRLLCASDFLFIRGEDSLSRACLSGHPFVWHAYPQSEDYQLVKVRALLDVMESFFSEDDFRLIRDFWLWYNNEDMPDFDSAEGLYRMLKNYASLSESFGNFSKMLMNNGNLAEHLMTFIGEIV